MELIIKAIMLGVLTYILLITEMLLNRECAECMKSSRKDVDSIDVVNAKKIEEEPYCVIKNERIESEPLPDYHSELGFSKLKHSESYMDVSEADQIYNKKCDNIDKGSAFVVGGSSLIGSNYFSKGLNSFLSGGLGFYHNTVLKEHAKIDIDEQKWNTELRKEAFLDSKERMGEEAYNRELKSFIETNLPNDRFITKEESLENRYKFYNQITKKENDQNSD